MRVYRSRFIGGNPERQSNSYKIDISNVAKDDVLCVRICSLEDNYQEEFLFHGGTLQGLNSLHFQVLHGQKDRVSWYNLQPFHRTFIKEKNLPFIIDYSYSRKDIYSMIGISPLTKGGNWDTGYNKFNNDWFIFSTLGMAGRTGHNYPNEYVGDKLRWYGKTNSKIYHPSIQSMINGSGKVYIFTRTDSSTSFKFGGIARAESFSDVTPVEIVWTFDLDTTISSKRLGEEVFNDDLWEGSFKNIRVNVFERNPHARQMCIAHYKAICFICKFDFEEYYGDVGKDFIHVHHLKPLAEIRASYKINPIEDLRPLCPNCHSMIHRRNPAYSIDDIISFRKNKFNS